MVLKTSGWLNRWSYEPWKKGGRERGREEGREEEVMTEVWTGESGVKPWLPSGL